MMRTSDVYTYTTHRLVQLCAAMQSVSGAERQGCLLGASWMLWQRRRGVPGGRVGGGIEIVDGGGESS